MTPKPHLQHQEISHSNQQQDQVLKPLIPPDQTIPIQVLKGYPPTPFKVFARVHIQIFCQKRKEVGEGGDEVAKRLTRVGEADMRLLLLENAVGGEGQKLELVEEAKAEDEDEESQLKEIMTINKRV